MAANDVFLTRFYAKYPNANESIELSDGELLIGTEAYYQKALTKAIRLGLTIYSVKGDLARQQVYPDGGSGGNPTVVYIYTADVSVLSTSKFQLLNNNTEYDMITKGDLAEVISAVLSLVTGGGYTLNTNIAGGYHGVSIVNNDGTNMRIVVEVMGATSMNLQAYNDKTSKWTSFSYN